MRGVLFADDCALIASSEDEMQRNMDTFLSACDVFGLTISTQKTRSCFSQHPTQPTLIQPSQSRARSCKTSLHLSAVPCPEMCLSTTRLMQELSK